MGTGSDLAHLRLHHIPLILAGVFLKTFATSHIGYVLLVEHHQG